MTPSFHQIQDLLGDGIWFKIDDSGGYYQNFTRGGKFYSSFKMKDDASSFVDMSYSVTRETFVTGNKYLIWYMEVTDEADPKYVNPDYEYNGKKYIEKGIDHLSNASEVSGFSAKTGYTPHVYIGAGQPPIEYRYADDSARIFNLYDGYNENLILQK